VYLNVIRFVGFVSPRTGTIGTVNQLRHFDTALKLRVVEKAQRRHRVDVQHLVELRMQPARLVVQDEGRGVRLGTQHRKMHLGVRVVRRQL